ncbi:MAG: winged helix DNA-binding domain-containing protein [Bacteroidota bacterium]
MSNLSTDIAKRRLYAQQLSGTTFRTAQQTVAWLGAVQGQEYAQTKWGLGLRLPHLNDSTIEQELTDGKIIRTHLLRPTWHLVSSQDIRWLLQLTGPRVNAANASMYARLELDTPLFKRCNTILGQLLEGNRHLTREEINAEFKKNKIEAQGLRLSYLMMRAELDGLVCSGIRRGSQSTYALLEERVAPTRFLDPEEALAELTKRYFASRGPATMQDFSTWSGLSLTHCKKGVVLTASWLERCPIEGKDYYFPADTASQPAPEPQVYLLPIYDEYIMGYQDRTAYLALKNVLTPSPPFVYNSMVVVDGQILGTWKRTLGKQAIEMAVDLFQPFTSVQQKAFDQAIHRFEAFNGLPLNKTGRPN